MSMELEDVQRELNRQKEILDTTNVASIIDRVRCFSLISCVQTAVFQWERRVRDLENQVSERDVIVHTQQAIINKLRAQRPTSPSRSRLKEQSGNFLATVYRRSDFFISLFSLYLPLVYI